jgi:hypothetical protein
MSEDIRKMIDKVKNFKQFVNEDIEKGKRNTSWSMRQESGEAVQGFIAFLDGKSMNDNPYNDAKTMKDGVKYKDWIAGYRNGEDATPDQIKMFNWIYSR